jgi:AcrR family transcriptional regulator
VPKSSYHHGDLRRVVLATAVELIAAEGVDNISLRELARRAGVSHAAPAHHFGDKAGLFTAIAAEGYELLAATLEGSDEDRPAPLKEQGVRYVEFAEKHPGHFAVMFRPDLLHADDPDLAEARARSSRALRGGVRGLSETRRPDDIEDAALAAWALAHGFAALRRSGSLDQRLQGRDPSEAFRAVASHLFSPPT